MNLEKVLRRIEARFPNDLGEICDRLRVETTITNPDACSGFCRGLVQTIEDLGGEAEIREREGIPSVFGRIDAGAPRTVIVYKNYDVVPAEPTHWKMPPFSASILKREGKEEVVVCRGAAEPKGPLLGLLKALAAIQSTGSRFPVNLIFILEGDEQLGSPGLPGLMEEKRKELSEADAVWIPKFSQSYSGIPVIPLGFKGILMLELICSGGRWGGPSGLSLHSSNAAWVASPVWRLVQALSTMMTEEEEIAVEGFYDEIVHSIPKRIPAHSALGAEMVDYLREHHVICFKQDLPDVALFRRYLLSPTCNISNLLVHPSSIWSKLVLPSEARAWIDIRLVPDMDPDRILGRIREHLSVMGFGEIETVVHLAYPPCTLDPESPLVGIWQSIYRKHGREPEVHPSSGVSNRVALFGKQMGLPVCVGGMGTGGKAFHDNEYATVEGIRNFEKSAVEFLHAFAGMRAEG